MKILMFSDEFEEYQNHLNTIRTQMKEQQKRLGEAHQQDPNARHDNFDFEDARREVSRLNNLYANQRKIIDNVRIITFDVLNTQDGQTTQETEEKETGKKVSLWNKIILVIDDQEFRFMIGGYESKIPGRIAYNSPLGQKIMTKKVGESCKIQIGKEIKTVIIKEIK